MIQTSHSETKRPFMDGYLRENLKLAKEVIQKDWDMVFVIDGTEGGGKSALAQQMAYECDQTICLERVCFTPEEFIEAVKKCEKYQAVIFDEGYTGLSSRGTMTDINKVIVEMLAEIRQKNLFIFIVLPTFFDLDKYVALWRSRTLIHIYTGKSFERGYFMFFNTERKKDLYVYGKKTYSYRIPKANFIGRFPKGYMVDEEAYRKKKLDSLSEKKIGAKRQVKITEDEHKKWLWTRIKEANIRCTNEEKARLLGMSISSYYNWLDKDDTDTLPSKLP